MFTNTTIIQDNYIDVSISTSFLGKRVILPIVYLCKRFYA